MTMHNSPQDPQSDGIMQAYAKRYPPIWHNYLTLDSWDDQEACCLLLSIDPKTYGKLYEDTPVDQIDFATHTYIRNAVSYLQDAIHRSQEVGAITCISVGRYSIYGNSRSVKLTLSPYEVVRWAQSKAYAIPEQMDAIPRPAVEQSAQESMILDPDHPFLA